MNAIHKSLLVLVSVLSLLTGPVQAQQVCNPNLPEATPTVDFTLNADGTAVHNKTALMWMRCALGQTWDGTTCTGTASTHDWPQALTEANSSTFAGHTDWRLPNIKELRSIVETQCTDPSINENVFPNLGTTSSFVAYFWTASGLAGDPGNAMKMSFLTGNLSFFLKSVGYQVRLVRGGQLFDSFDSTLAISTTMITSDNPDPSVVGWAVTVVFSVTSMSGTPTGDVTVMASTGESCMAPVAVGSCKITFPTVGARTLTASYAGDVNVNPSVSAGEPHTVTAVFIPTLSQWALALAALVLVGLGWLGLRRRQGSLG